MFTVPAAAQGIVGRWLVAEDDGSEIAVELCSGGTGRADWTYRSMMEAVPYGEGCRWWGTFRMTGGYYFTVKGVKSTSIVWSMRDSTFAISLRGKPSVSVKAWIEEEYSTRDVSEEGGYKKQILAQWREDFTINKDVKKEKERVKEFLMDERYSDIFDVFVAGDYGILSCDSVFLSLRELSDSTVKCWERQVPPPHTPQRR